MASRERGTLHLGKCRTGCAADSSGSPGSLSVVGAQKDTPSAVGGRRVTRSELACRPATSSSPSVQTRFNGKSRLQALRETVVVLSDLVSQVVCGPHTKVEELISSPEVSTLVVSPPQATRSAWIGIDLSPNAQQPNREAQQRYAQQRSGAGRWERGWQHPSQGSSAERVGASDLRRPRLDWTSPAPAGDLPRKGAGQNRSLPPSRRARGDALRRARGPVAWGPTTTDRPDSSVVRLRSRAHVAVEIVLVLHDDVAVAPPPGAVHPLLLVLVASGDD